MSLSYWPSVKEVKSCIRTEAETLPDATLMAVHEPMFLRKVASGEMPGEPADEFMLLDHIIRTNRPIPILGESGVGKSHAIRWLDVQLRRKGVGKNWHIVRIGKNASLRQALTTLLEGLHGSIFEEARLKIESVGKNLKARSVAQHLIVFVETRLEELYEAAEQELNNAHAQGLVLDAGDEARIKIIRRHAKRSGLSALIGDPNFNKQLISEGKCFYQIAKRFTEGSSDEEIEDNKFEVELEDIEKNTTLGNLSLEARTYVRDARINTSKEMRQEAVNLLNECLNDACKEAFQQLFQFRTGSFLELFVSIRKYLNEDGKTLFVLLEDMATISAIEDVLIDSLMQEEDRVGGEILCPLHSAIAVTTGYQGYERRKATIRTRARYEWYIDERCGSVDKTYNRIQDFCGRYLNAARHGEANLKNGFGTSELQADWPGVWRSDDEDEIQRVAVFGDSPKGFPLFPYTRTSLEALADRFCQSHEQLEFNPRKILQDILLEPLGTFREQYIDGYFPPAGFADIPCPSSLQTDLRLKIRDDLERAETLSAIWGYGTESLTELAHQMPAQIAAEFGFKNLSDVLEATIPQEPSVRTRRFVSISDSGRGSSPVEVSLQQPDKNSIFIIDREVDDYFVKRSISQSAARTVRRELFNAIIERLTDYTDWYGIKTWPLLKRGQNTQPLIHIPYNENNPPGFILTFGSEKIFSDRSNSLPYKQFMVAVIRREFYVKELGDTVQTWTYPKGSEDYCNYKNFLDSWIFDAMKKLVVHQRANTIQHLEERLSAVAALTPQISNFTAIEKLDHLVETSDAIKMRVSVITGLEDWDQFLTQSLAEWDQKQANWLNSYSKNRHAVEGDLIKKRLHGLTNISIPPTASGAAQKSRQAFIQECGALKLLEGCTNRQEFEQVLKNLYDLVSRLGSSNQFKGMDIITSARKYKNLIKKIIESDNWEAIKSSLILQGPFVASNAIKALQGIDMKEARILNECLTVWQTYFNTNLPRLLNENAMQGADRRKTVEDDFDQLVTQFDNRVITPKETSK